MFLRDRKAAIIATLLRRAKEGRTVAALNVVSTRQKLETRAVQKELLPLLQEAARELRPLL